MGKKKTKKTNATKFKVLFESGENRPESNSVDPSSIVFQPVVKNKKKPVKDPFEEVEIAKKLFSSKPIQYEEEEEEEEPIVQKPIIPKPNQKPNQKPTVPQSSSKKSKVQYQEEEEEEEEEDDDDDDEEESIGMLFTVVKPQNQNKEDEEDEEDEEEEDKNKQVDEDEKTGEDILLDPRQVERLRIDYERTGYRARDYDENGLLIDGYDYKKHLKFIGQDPSAVFIPAGGGVIGAKYVVVQPPTVIEEEEEEKFGEVFAVPKSKKSSKNKNYPKEDEMKFQVIIPSTDCNDDEELLAAMAALSDEEADVDELFGGPLDDDFVIQAAGIKNLARRQEREYDYEDNYSETSEKVSKNQEMRDRDEQTMMKRRENLLDEQFDELLKQYDSDEIGELDEDDNTLNGGVDISNYRNLVNDFLATGVFNIYKNPENSHGRDKGDVIGGTKENPYVTQNEFRAETKRLGLLNELEFESEDEEELHKELDAMIEPPVKAEWDCETILTTYSTLENHPKYISEPKQIKIKLSQKNGLPVEFLEQREKEKEEKKKASRNEEDEEDSESETEESEGSFVPNFRQKGETKEERKLRKKLVKDAKKNRRSQKKETKGMFKEEKQKQVQLSLSTAQQKLTQFKL